MYLRELEQPRGSKARGTLTYAELLPVLTLPRVMPSTTTVGIRKFFVRRIVEPRESSTPFLDPRLDSGVLG